MTQKMGNVPNAAPYKAESRASITGMRYTATATIKAAISPRKDETQAATRLTPIAYKSAAIGNAATIDDQRRLFAMGKYVCCHKRRAYQRGLARCANL